jgi:hypothetical protein
MLLTLLFSLSGAAIGEYSDFGRWSLATDSSGRHLGGLAAKFNADSKSLSIDFVGVTQKGQGIGTGLYRQAISAAGDVHEVVGTAALDNAAAISKGGILAAPRTKILDKIGEWTHSYDDATKKMKATRK